jgi:predicted regulator of Ras-like GTPase activity (Roadblock/LC7/MglB family)
MPHVYRVDILEERLQRLCQSVPGILGTVIVSVEGFVVAAYLPQQHPIDDHRTNTPQVAAMAATLIALGEQTLQRLAQGKMERLMIEGEGGAMIVYPIDRNSALAAMIDKNAKIGLVLLSVARAAHFLREILGSAA